MKSYFAARIFHITVSYKKKNICRPIYLLNTRLNFVSYNCNSVKHAILHKVKHNSNDLVNAFRTLLKSRTHHSMMLIRLLLQAFFVLLNLHCLYFEPFINFKLFIICNLSSTLRI